MTLHPWEAPPEGAAADIAGSVAAAVPELTTARLRLRAPRLADFDAYARIATGERGVHIGGPMARDEAWLDFAQMAAGWLLRGHGVWSVERRADAALLGFLPLCHEYGDPEPELGFLFLEAAEGLGYAHEAAAAARAFAFDRLGWSTVVSYVDPANARAIRLAERLGARPDPAAPHPADPGIRVFRNAAPEPGR
jgi:RimJ/RimL family protein N-acetyltransferase